MRRRLPIVVAVLVLCGATLTGCVRAADTDHCRTLCTAAVGDTAYSILVPKAWNGTLLLYSHGFQTDLAGHHPYLSADDSDGQGTDPISRALLAQGYALAGSAYPTTGWDIDGAVDAAIALHTTFVSLVGRPKRVIAWGTSMGGLITELLAEREGWVDAAAPLCGALAGTLANVDNMTRALAVVQGLTGADLSVDGTESADDLTALMSDAADQIDALGRNTDGGPPAVLALASSLGLPTRSPSHPATTRASRLSAAAQNVTNLVRLGLAVLSDLDLRHGAGVGDAATAQVRIGTGKQLRSDLAGLGVDVAQLQGYLAATPSPAPDARARRSLAATDRPTYRLRVPTLTMHTTVDPSVIVANETVFRERVAAAGRSALLRQVFIAPPGVGSGGAADTDAGGLGHCDFTTDQQVALIGAVSTWVRTGTAPTESALAARIGAGVDADYVSPAWPA